MIVVSRGRAQSLRLCLTGLGQLCYPEFEIIVVADAEGVRAVTEMGLAARVRLLRVDAANISAARNAGLAQAAGEVVAFIDDDAVPEPTWLDHLTAPFADAEVAATGGYVIGRNGIRLQWQARAVNRLGEAVALTAPGAAPFVPAPPPGFVPKTEGTNCAFRRDVLAGLGGFDPAFRYYLDETDVNLRLAGAGARTMIVPQALVHHGYAESERRSADRVPRDLTEIGASTAVFLRKHAPRHDHAAAVSRIAAAQRRRLVRHMVAGGLEPRDIPPLLAGLADGMRAGMDREIAPLAAIPAAPHPFLRFRRAVQTGKSVPIAGRIWHRNRLRARAAGAVAQGDIVSLFLFSPTALPHRVRFHPGGWWEQTGGLFGRCGRDQPVLQIAGFRARVDKEWARVSMARQCR